MEKNIKASDHIDNPGSVYSELLNDQLRKALKAQIPEGEQNWLAESVFHMPAPTLSACVNGTRPVPGWLIPVVDKAFKNSNMLDVLTNAATSGPAVHKPIDPRSIERLFVLALKEEGTFNAMVAEGITDHFSEPSQIDHLDRELTKLSHFILAMRERLHEMRDQERERRLA